MVKIEEYWKMRVEIEEKRKREASKSRERQRRESALSEERGRSTDAERRRKRSQRAPDLLSPNDAPLHRQHSRGRPRSTVDPYRETNDAGMQGRRRPRSFDASCAHEGRRQSRSPSPYPPEWTDEQKRRYAEGFRMLAQPHEKEEPGNGWIHQFPRPPADQPSHLSPPPLTDQYGRRFSAPATDYNGYERYGSSVSAGFISPQSVLSGSHQDGSVSHDSGSDDSDDALSKGPNQKQDDLSLLERLGIASPPSSHT